MTVNAENLLGSLNDITWENYVRVSTELTKINKENIDGELITHAQIYSYYHGLYSIIKSRLEETENRLDRFVSVTRQKEQLLREVSGKRATDKYLEDYVKSQDEYSTDKELLNQFRYKANLIKGLLQSLEHKKDCLIQLSANGRAETKLYG